LQNTTIPHRARQRLQRRLAEIATRLREIRLDLLQRQLPQLLGWDISHGTLTINAGRATAGSSDASGSNEHLELRRTIETISARIHGSITKATDGVSGLFPLTGREQEILTMIADGMTNGKAAAALGIPPQTVQSHVRNAMAKLDSETRTQAVATAFRRSLLA